jgi:hypothetical protein
MNEARKITARRYRITARANNTAGQTSSYDTSCFPTTTWNIEMKMHPAGYFPLRVVSAALRGTQGGTAVTQKLQTCIAREQQAEARRLDEAIWKNLKELGYGS